MAVCRILQTTGEQKLHLYFQSQSDESGIISTYFHPGDYIVYKTKRRSSGTESAWVYRKAPCPECGVETAWGIGIQHSRKRCRKCELELQRRWNRRAAKNYRVRNGLIHTPLYVTCQQCGKKFQPKRSTARFCTTTCRVKSHRRDVSALTTSQ